MYVYVCMYVCTYVCMNLCLYVYMTVCLYACVGMYGCMDSCGYVCVHQIDRNLVDRVFGCQTVRGCCGCSLEFSKSVRAALPFAGEGYVAQVYRGCVFRFWVDSRPPSLPPSLALSLSRFVSLGHSCNPCLVIRYHSGGQWYEHDLQRNSTLQWDAHLVLLCCFSHVFRIVAVVLLFLHPASPHSFPHRIIDSRRIFMLERIICVIAIFLDVYPD